MKIMSSTCKCCGQIKNKIQKREGKKFKYVDENNTLWLGKYCPSCKKKYYTSIRKNKELISKKCLICETEFQTNHPTYKYCSKICSKKAFMKKKADSKRLHKNCITCGKLNTTKSKYCSKECRPKRKYIPKLKKEIIKNCVTCNKEFKTIRNGKYCSKKCRPSEIKSRIKYNKSLKAKQKRKDRKSVEKFKQPISKNFKNEIINIYNNKPLGYHVDHIIPLNHPDICGLHVPWNLTYLSIDENITKSNQFDYTMQNESWKIIKVAI